MLSGYDVGLRRQSKQDGNLQLLPGSDAGSQLALPRRVSCIEVVCVAGTALTSLRRTARSLLRIGLVPLLEGGRVLVTTSDSPLSLEERKVAIEEQKLNNEQDKLAFEKSWRKILGSGFLAGVVALAVAGVGYWQSRIQEINRTTEADVAQKQQDGLWGIKVLELYVTHPREFDPVASPATAQSNMSALVVAAPDLMKPILLKRQDSLVRTDALAVISPAINAIQSAIGQSRGTAPPSVPGVPSGVNPSNFSVYIQYGSGAEEFATKFGKTMASNHFRVPDLEAVPQAPSVPEVRYYRPTQKPLSEWLAQQIDQESPGQPSAIVKSIGSDNSPDGIIEVWIPAGWS